MTPEEEAEWTANTFLKHEIIHAGEFENAKASALMAIQKNIYNKVVFPPVDSKNLTAEAFIAMREQEHSNRQKYNEIYLKIIDRYAFENKWREYWTPSDRRDYTPKQKRRIRKQTNKWRKRLYPM